MFKNFRTTAILSIMPFCTLSLSGQSWLALGTQWHHNEYAIYNSEEYLGFEKRIILSDTSINGQACKNIMNRPGGLLTMYEENEKVYLFNHVSNEFELFYDINSPIGDTWSVQRIDLPLESLQVTVMDKAIFKVNGHQLKTLIVNINYFVFNYVDTIMERIGYLGMFAPHMPGIVDGYFRGIRCFEDSFLGFVDFNDLQECDYVELPTANTHFYGRISSIFKLYPNPFESTVTLHFPDFHHPGYQLKLFDGLGKKVFESEHLDETNILELSALQKGIYFINVSGKDMCSTQKLIKN